MLLPSISLRLSIRSSCGERRRGTIFWSIQWDDKVDRYPERKALGTRIGEWQEDGHGTNFFTRRLHTVRWSVATVEATTGCRPLRIPHGTFRAENATTYISWFATHLLVLVTCSRRVNDIGNHLVRVKRGRQTFLCIMKLKRILTTKKRTKQETC